MIKKATAPLLGVLCLALAACLVPERFNAKVEVKPDGSYSFKYTGTAVHALAAAQIKKAGSLSAKDEADLKADAEKAAKKPGVKQIAYKGSGRYELQLEEQKPKGASLDAMNIFKVWTDKDGVMTIASTEIKPKEKAELEGMGITIDGTLEVTLPKNAEVLSHNATSTPNFMGLFGTYSWKIGKLDQRPMMKVRLK